VPVSGTTGNANRTLTFGVAAVLAALLVAVQWLVGTAVGWLDWRTDYGAGADNIWQQNLTVHAWSVATGTTLAGLLTLHLLPALRRLSPLSRRSPVVGGTAAGSLVSGGAVVGGSPVAGGMVVGGSRVVRGCVVAVGALFGGVVAGVGLSGAAVVASGEPVWRLYLAGVLPAVLGALVVWLLGRLSWGTVAGVAVGAVLPWAFVPLDGAWLAYSGSVGQDGAVAVLAPLACAVLPVVVAVLVGTRTGAGWPAALLGAVPVPVLLLTAYRLAGPNELDHLQQAEAYSYAHLAAAVALLTGAVLACATARPPSPPAEVPGRPGDPLAGRPRSTVAVRASRWVAAFALTSAIAVTTSNFTVGRYVPFAAEVTVEVVGALVGLLAVAEVLAAAERQWPPRTAARRVRSPAG
jgi:hypothetical protein